MDEMESLVCCDGIVAYNAGLPRQRIGQCAGNRSAQTTTHFAGFLQSATFLRFLNKKLVKI